MTETPVSRQEIAIPSRRELALLSPEEIAIRIADESSAAEREALRSWIERLLEIRAAGLPVFRRAAAAIRATLDSRVIWPAVKRAKRIVWNQRSATARLGLVGMAVGIALFGGQTAGLAALGGAVAVPLWIVFGAGAAFAHVLYKELAPEKREKSTGHPSGDVLNTRKDAEGVHRIDA